MLRRCAHPAEFLGAGDWEIVTGRIGDELILCGKEKAALATWATSATDALNGRSYWETW